MVIFVLAVFTLLREKVHLIGAYFVIGYKPQPFLAQSLSPEYAKQLMTQTF